MRRPRLLDAVLLVLVLSAPVGAQTQERPLVPEGFALSEAARRAIQADWLTDAERRALRVFHGVWDDRDLDTDLARAMVALNAWQLEAPILSDERVPVELRAEARLLAGDVAEAIALLDGVDTIRAARILAEAHEVIGDQRAAGQVIAGPVRRLLGERVDDAAVLTDCVRAMEVRSRLQGQPARDFQTMMDLLGRAHQRLDRLYWPARLAEARLLLDKDNEQQAIEALHETLALNPRCSEAWYRLGRVALGRFDFDSVTLAADALRRLDADHPLATLLLAESRLTQDDPEDALELLEPIVARWPRLRPAHALVAAARALLYDDDALREAIAAYEALSPGSATVYYVVGKQLSFNRQYEAAAEMLEEAVRRQPAWPIPQIELGLMELQSGRDEKALDALRAVTSLDPFNKRAANSLFLLEELAEYKQVESEHFIVRYRPGIDRIMVDMMLEPLERIHAIVSERFEFEPDRKTTIELLPDHQRFAVRITGMPFIHTIAACTGPVIAMEVPREGNPREHLGVFDWPRVVQHEYTHTITLGQTRNRIPHWLTEAAAVSMEFGPRTYDRCQMLAQSYEQGTLFDLDEIKWAFVRPKRPGDRGKAYAQGHWMVEYMNERFGDSALVRLLQQYFDGEREQEAIPNALGISREQFYLDFLEWAGDQVDGWGLLPEPTLVELTDAVRWADPGLTAAMEKSQQARLDVIVKTLTGQIGMPASSRRRALTPARWPRLVRPPVDPALITDDVLDEWLSEYPDHPDLVELQIRRLLREDPDPDEAFVPLLERYATLRPVDPFPHKKLAQIFLAGDEPTRAIEHLEALDAREEKTPVYAVQLAKLYRRAGDLDRALARATRALYINPYHAPNRELAAAIAVEHQRLDVARLHIEALTVIEPDRPQHRRRLEAVERMMGGGGS